MERVLPLPTWTRHRRDSLAWLSDDRLAKEVGVHIAFTERSGGVSVGPYQGLNLAAHVSDDQAAVLENRRQIMDALGGSEAVLVVPNQVHGTELVAIASADPDSIAEAQAAARDAADGVVVAVPGVAALLNFADCAPVIVVAPTGAFAVVHCGWRGTLGRIASKAVVCLADLAGLPPEGMAKFAQACNAYIGPHIRQECFECGADVASAFLEAFGPSAIHDGSQVDLAESIAVDLMAAGLRRERILDVGICTACTEDRFFSYRASGGLCGRHGAIAFAEGGAL